MYASFVILMANGAMVFVPFNDHQLNNAFSSRHHKTPCFKGRAALHKQASLRKGTFTRLLRRVISFYQNTKHLAL